MGACASKVKWRRKRRKPEKDVNAYVLDDRHSVLYEDIECNGAAHLSPNQIDNPTPGNEEQNNGPDRNYNRSTTCISRDSALGNDSLHSRPSSMGSLAHHETTDYSDYSDNTAPCRYVQHSSRHTRSLDLELPTSADWVDNTCQARRRRVSIVVPTDEVLDGECASKKEMPTEAIPYMIDVFMPLLQGSIRVLEIIPHLHFIDDTETFRNKDRESPREAVIMLIERIKASQEPGKWQAFLEALSSGGYTHIYDLLKGHTENDLTIHRKLLRLFTPSLVNRIEPREFLDHLYEKHVISEADMEEIRCEDRNRGPIAASLMLLESLPRKNPDWYNIFVQVLNKCGLEDMVHDFDFSEEPGACCSGSQNHSAPCRMPTHSNTDTKCARRRSDGGASGRQHSHTSSSGGSKPHDADTQAPTLPQLPPPQYPSSARRRQTDQAQTMERIHHTPDQSRYITSAALDRSYLTPTDDYLPIVSENQQSAGGNTSRSNVGTTSVISGGSIVRSGKVDEAGDDDNHHYMSLYTNESMEIARLREQRESLKREVEETKVKNKLKREIQQLSKELQALKNADLSEESDSKGQTEALDENSNEAVTPDRTNVELQKDSAELTHSETQTVDTQQHFQSKILQELEALKLNMFALSERMTTPFPTTRADGVTDIYFPMEQNLSSIVPLYKAHAPLPHLNSREDSGMFSDYSTPYLSI